MFCFFSPKVKNVRLPTYNSQKYTACCPTFFDPELWEKNHYSVVPKQTFKEVSVLYTCCFAVRVYITFQRNPFFFIFHKCLQYTPQSILSQQKDGTQLETHTVDLPASTTVSCNCYSRSIFSFISVFRKQFCFLQKPGLRSSTAAAKQSINEAEACFQQFAAKTVTKAPGPALSFSHLCKADAACTNEAVWYNTELKVQFCDVHPMEGTKKKYLKRKKHSSDEVDTDEM